MNIKKLFNSLLLSSLLIITTSSVLVNGKENYCDYVNPYIGSGFHGHVFVGANVPFGMVQVGPQNIYKGWDWCSGYHYSDSILIGFSHTHLSGTGCADLGDVLVMPFIGDKRTKRGEQNDISGSCSIYFNHNQEKVSPGYYSINMSNGVDAEMTSTERVAIHHYTFPQNKESHILLNLVEGIGSEDFSTYANKIDDYTIEGYRFTHGWSPTRKVFFYIKLDKPISSFSLYNNDRYSGENHIVTHKEISSDNKSVENGAKGIITLKNNANEVYMKVALSSVSCENAKKNMNTELPDFDFNKVHQMAINKWNNQLSQIKIKSKNKIDKIKFYTAMYHICMAPQLYMDVNNEFRGIDDKIYKGNWNNYSCFSLWDTYRTLNPLFTIIKPEMVNDFIKSFISIYHQNGKLPIWPLNGGETECMPGYSAIPIIADAYMKGIRDYNVDEVYKQMVSSATYDKQKGVSILMRKGYIPCDKEHEATSMALEYAAGDCGIALMAKDLGKTDDYKYFIDRNNAYETYFDKSIRFIRPKMDDGSWRTPYNPFRSLHGVGDFCEGTGWQYTFFNPQNPELMIKLMGGDKPFCSKLDSLFTVSGDMGEGASSDITGLIGQYAHGNEPSHSFCYYYNYAGEQWKTAKMVRKIQKEFYTDKPDGIIGNEDCGQMSAWYIMSALGFYQVNPSNGIFVFSSPSFEKAEIKVNNKSFTVIAKNNSDKNIYIQSAKLNGRDYAKSFITYHDIMNGGVLEFKMGAKPNKKYGYNRIDRPVSAQ